MKNQRSILGFFQKVSPSTPASTPPKRTEPESSPLQRISEAKKTSKKQTEPAQTPTPGPSSDVVVPEDEVLGTSNV